MSLLGCLSTSSKNLLIHVFSLKLNTKPTNHLSS